MKAPRSVLALLVGLAFTLPLSAAEIVGIVSRVDLDKKELLLDGRGLARGKAVTLVLDDETAVLFGRQTGSPTDLAAGKRVRVVYDVRDNKQIARVIHVNGPKPKTTPAPMDKNAITGVLRRVALTDREIVVIGPGSKGKETETTVTVPETARITKGGKAATFEELKEDDPVSIVVEKREGRLTATTVQVGPGGTAPAEKSDVVPKIRLALRLADFLLQKMEKPASQP